MNKPDLKTIIETKTEDAALAEQFFGVEIDKKWLKAIKPGVDAAQLVVDELFAGETAPEEKTPQSIEGTTDLLEKLRTRLRVAVDASPADILKAALDGKWARRVVMLTPLALPILPAVHFAHLAMIRKLPWMGYIQEQNTLIQVARNLVTHEFLKTEAEWAFLVDGDIVPCFADPAYFYDKNKLGVSTDRIGEQWLRVNTLDRLLHAKKTIVGAVYQQRKAGGKICNPIELNPQGKSDVGRELRARGPQDKVIEVPWCATGCLLVHRSVYTAIMEQRPDLQKEGKPFNFFGHDVGEGGEDAAFGKLAAACGHASYLDLGAWVGHCGNHTFFPEGK